MERFMSKRYTLQEVKEKFSEHGWECFADEYINNQTKMKCRCYCSLNTEITFNRFLCLTHKRCSVCYANDRTHSNETKEKMRKAKLGKKLSKEHRAKLKGRTSPMKGKIFSAERIARMSAFMKGKPSPMAGKRHTPETIEKLSGANSHLWRGGVSSESKLARTTPEYNEWRKEVYKKDNWSCQNCGIKCLGYKDGIRRKESKKIIAAHHFIDFVGDGNTPSDYDVDNGITVCKSCHRKIHNYLNMLEKAKQKFLCINF